MVQIAIPAPGVRPESQEFAELIPEEQHAGQRTRCREPRLERRSWIRPPGFDAFRALPSAVPDIGPD
jgi:hypothetical protein